MSTNATKKTGFWVIPAAIVLLSLIALLSHYSGKSCECKKPAKQHHAASITNETNSYITIATSNGDSINLSSKFAHVVKYMTDESIDTLDATKEERTKWKMKLKKWRTKMVNNNIAPSPSNFMDIIELSKMLDEK